MKLFEKLNRIKHVTTSENEVIKYIISKPESVIDMTIYNLAEKTNTSTSTIIRLCKKCGYSGFRNLKVNLIQSIDNEINSIESVDANIPFGERDTDIMVARKISQLSIETIRKSFNLLSTKQLNYTVEKIISANNVLAIGIGDNYLRLCDFQIKLCLINFNIQMASLESEQKKLAIFSKPHDVAIIVSYSGTTSEIVDIAKRFFLNRTSIIAITSNENSPLAKFANILLLIPNKENNKLSVANFYSHIAIEYILNSLYSCIFNRDFKKNCKSVRKK